MLANQRLGGKSLIPRSSTDSGSGSGSGSDLAVDSEPDSEDGHATDSEGTSPTATRPPRMDAAPIETQTQIPACTAAEGVRAPPATSPESRHAGIQTYTTDGTGSDSDSVPGT